MTVKSTTLRVEPEKIKAGAKAQTAPAGKSFSSFLGAVEAFQPMSTEIMYQASGQNAAAVLHGAFTGVSGAAGAYGYGPTGGGFGTGLGYGYGGFGALSEYPGMMGVGKYGTYSGAAQMGTMPGDPSMYTGDLINTMNTNNLKLLELQAVMQSNMQAWNTKSNILSADHRARMAMIEKFTARG